MVRPKEAVTAGAGEVTMSPSACGRKGVSLMSGLKRCSCGVGGYRAPLEGGVHVRG